MRWLTQSVWVCLANMMLLMGALFAAIGDLTASPRQPGVETHLVSPTLSALTLFGATSNIVCVCACACMRACVRACVRARVRASLSARACVPGQVRRDELSANFPNASRAARPRPLARSLAHALHHSLN